MTAFCSFPTDDEQADTWVCVIRRDERIKIHDECVRDASLLTFSSALMFNKSPHCCISALCTVRNANELKLYFANVSVSSCRTSGLKQEKSTHLLWSLLVGGLYRKRGFLHR